MAYASALSAFSFNTTNIPAIGNVAFSMQRTPLDVTSIGAWNTYFIDGVATAAFTLDVFFSRADHNLLITDILLPTGASRPKAFVITLGTVGANAETISGNCIITSWDVVSASSDVVRGSFSCQIIGPVSFTGGGATTQASTGTAEIVPS